MKAIILAGGLGSRLAEETSRRPKPMAEIGGRPILWHIMNIFAAHGVGEFLVAPGYKGEVVKQYFLNYHALSSDLTIDLGSGRQTITVAPAATGVSCMDTLKEKNMLEELWATGDAAWKTWDDAAPLALAR